MVLDRRGQMMMVILQMMPLQALLFYHAGRERRCRRRRRGRRRRQHRRRQRRGCRVMQLRPNLVQAPGYRVAGRRQRRIKPMVGLQFAAAGAAVQGVLVLLPSPTAHQLLRYPFQTCDTTATTSNNDVHRLPGTRV